MILRSLLSDSIMNPGQFRIWAFRIHNLSSTLFPNYLVHRAVWRPSYNTQFPCTAFSSLWIWCLSLSLHLDLAPHSFWLAVLQEYRYRLWLICLFWLDACVAHPSFRSRPGPYALLSSHIESSSWTITVSYISVFLSNFSPRLSTYSQSVKTHLSSFLVCGSQLCSSRSIHSGKDFLFCEVVAGELWGALFPCCSCSKSDSLKFIWEKGWAQTRKWEATHHGRAMRGAPFPSIPAKFF